MKPVLITVDDDREVLRAVERDLRRHYGENYRVLRAESGSSALEALKTLKLRNDPVALLLVDQRMPEMTGVEFLERAMELYPDAKRALLTAYADTDAAIRAINTARIEYYLMKPWIRRKNSCILCWTISSKIGRHLSIRPSKASVSSATAGRPSRI